MSRLLLVEDDVALVGSLSRYLASEGFDVDVAGTLDEASRKRAAVDLILLDWMLPDGQGIDWLRELRAAHDATPVVLLTARTEVVDRVVGLETGADDYVTKPFDPRELVARLRARVRSGRAATAQVLTCGDVRVDVGRREVEHRGAPVVLTRMEFDLLRLLLEAPNRVFTRDELLNQVWGFEHFPTTRTVDTHVLQLRQKLDAELIETVRGVGYRLRAR